MKLFVCSIVFLGFSFLAYAEEGGSEYLSNLSYLNSKLEKVREMKERTEELIKEKSHITDRARILEIVTELNQIQTDLRKKNAEIRDLDYDLRFRYPEKGDQTERLYKKYNTSSEEISKKEEVVLEKLDKLLKKAKRVYGPTKKELEMARQAVERKKKLEEKPKSRFQPITVSE